MEIPKWIITRFKLKLMSVKKQVWYKRLTQEIRA